MQAWHATRSSATGKRRGPTKTVLGTAGWLGDAGNLRRVADTGNGGREAGSGWTWFGDAVDQDALTPTTTDGRDFEVAVTQDSACDIVAMSKESDGEEASRCLCTCSAFPDSGALACPCVSVNPGGHALPRSLPDTLQAVIETSANAL